MLDQVAFDRGRYGDDGVGVADMSVETAARFPSLWPPARITEPLLCSLTINAGAASALAVRENRPPG